MHLDALASYGMVPVATVRIVDDRFEIEVTSPAIAALDRCIYAFVISGEVVRLGSCKSTLALRLRSWRNDISRALQGRKSSAPPEEAAGWRALLATCEAGVIFTRRGTMVTTPVGTFNAYLAEECELIQRYKPRLNRSSR